MDVQVIILGDPNQFGAIGDSFNGMPCDEESVISRGESALCGRDDEDSKFEESSAFVVVVVASLRAGGPSEPLGEPAEWVPPGWVEVYSGVLIAAVIVADTRPAHW